MSLDSAQIDLSKAFEYGQGYVALSRVRTLGGLHLLGFNDRALEVHPDVAHQDSVFKKRSAAGEKRLRELSENELLEKQQQFLVLIGGSLEKKDPSRRTIARREVKGESRQRTRELVREGKNVSEIAAERGLAQSTIFSHIEQLVTDGRLALEEVSYLWEETGRSQDELCELHEMFTALDTTKLTPVRKRSNDRYSYEEIRLARMLLAK